VRERPAESRLATNIRWSPFSYGAGIAMAFRLHEGVKMEPVKLAGRVLKREDNKIALRIGNI
jgi:hypothetical protein